MILSIFCGFVASVVFNHSKCFKILIFLFSNKILVFRAGGHKMLVRTTNREDPDQTASDLGLLVCLGLIW